MLGPVLDPDEAKNLGAASTATLDIPSFGVLIKALQTNSDVDVLSNPHLLIMNNEDGEISVGSRVPFPVSTFGLGGGAAPGGAAPIPGFGGLSSFFPNVQREKVALELKLTPHVNEHDMVRLEVDEKISELAPGPSNLGPSTSERTAKTIVVAKDQQTILIGGLMSDKMINSVTKVPLLGDIPILGFFFRSSTKKIVKTNLIIALTPYVISDMSDLRRVLEKKMKERREFIERYGGQDRPSLDANVSLPQEGRHAGGDQPRRARGRSPRRRSCSDLRERQLQDESGPVELPVGRERWRAAAPTPARRRRRAGALRSRAVAKKRLGDLLLELKAKTPGAMPTLGPDVDRAGARHPAAGGRAPGRDPAQDARHHRGGPAAGARAAARDPLQPGSEDRRRRHRPGDVDPDRLRQAAPAAGGQARGRLRDGGDRRSAGDRRVRRPAHAAVSSTCSRSWCRRSGSSRSSTTSTAARHDKGGDLGEKDDEDDEGSSEELVDILDITDEAPIIRWVNSLLFNAVKERASDIHIEPGEKEVIVRYRIDGELYESRRAARQFMPSIISRVKIMAGLNIAEKRLPQDGRIRRKIAGKDIDMRVATVPTVKRGERIAIRLLDRESVLHDLADIGFGDDHLRQMDELIHKPARHHAGHRARPARARRRRSTPASPRSTRPTSTSSPSRIRSSTSWTASRRPRSTTRSA